MSDNVNTQLLERAAEMIDYFGDTTIGKILQADIDRDDLKGLLVHVVLAEGQAAQQHFYESEILGSGDVY